jgi:3-oxoacyl-[acyl-carrier-protein] synthase-3
MTRPVYIIDTAAYLPGEPVDNDAMEAVLGQAGERPSRARRTILRSNGIKRRHYAIDPKTGKPTHSNAQLAAEAVKKLGGRFDLKTLGVLACGTSIADQLMPGHAVMVQGELGLPMCEAVSTSGVCASGVASLKYAYLSVASGQTSSAVATGSELSSAVMTARNFAGEIEAKVAALETHPEVAFEKDFLRWMLSDGAGAALLQPGPREGAVSLRIDWIEICSYAGEMDTCMYAGAVKGEDGRLTGWARYDQDERIAQSVLAVKQDVRLLNDEIMRVAVERPLPGIIERRRLEAGKIDHFVPHYSSEFFRPRLRQAMLNVGFDIPEDRWFSNLSSRGNTGSASMYIMLDEIRRSGRVSAGDKLLCWVPESGRFTGCFLHFTAV